MFDGCGNTPMFGPAGPAAASVHDESWEFTDHWGGAAQQSGWVEIGAVDPDSANSDDRHPGVGSGTIDFAAGGQTTVLRRSTTGFLIGAGECMFEWIVRTPVAPVGAGDDFTFYCGFADGNAALPANGFGFTIDRTVASNNNYNIVTRNGGAGVQVDTGVAMITADFVRMRGVANAAGTRVDFFLDTGAGLVNVGNSVANLPAGDFGLSCLTAGVGGAV